MSKTLIGGYCSIQSQDELESKLLKGYIGHYTRGVILGLPMGDTRRLDFGSYGSSFHFICIPLNH